VRVAVQSVRRSLLEAATGQTSQKTTPATTELVSVAVAPSVFSRNF